MARRRSRRTLGQLRVFRPQLQTSRRDWPLNDQTTAAMTLLRARVCLTHVFQAKTPNLNAQPERFHGSLKSECLERMIFFGDQPLRRATTCFLEHYHQKRNHQGLSNKRAAPTPLAANTAELIT